MPREKANPRACANILVYFFQEERRDSSSIFHMGPELQFHRACLAIAAAVLAQMTGINIVTFYSTQIFETQLKYSAVDARIFSGRIHIWQFISAGIAVLLIDRFGRRKLLMAGALGMAIAQAALCGLNSDLTNPAARKTAIFFFFWAMFWFPVGLLLIPFMYAAEIAPLSIRHKVTAISACSNWLFNFLIAEFTPRAMKNIGWRYYIVYTCISAFAFVVHYCFFPETKGRTLEEIDEIFIKSKSNFDPVHVEKALPHGGLVGMELHQDEEKHAAVHAENVQVKTIMTECFSFGDVAIVPLYRSLLQIE